MALSSGARLGPYEILGPLGAGGMGEVYRARDTRLDRTVAIKILPGHLASDPSLKARFEREARAVSALSHPNICTLHDIGEQDGIHFLVMEHLEGETLSQRLDRGPMPLAEAATAATQIARALAMAHRQGVIHRDLKPGNVMLTKAGAKLLDFGLAKQGAESAPPISSGLMTKMTPLTAEGTIVGTWQYMSPEQLEGQEADSRSDIFGFGAVLYEMVTGRRAFEGRSQASLIAAIMGTEPPPMMSLAPATPPALDRVVRRCLAKDPDDRWQSAADLASELKWISEPDATSAASPGTPVPGAPPSEPSGVSEARPMVAAPRGGRTRERIGWAALTIALLIAVAALLMQPGQLPGPPERVVRASILPPAEVTFDTRFAPAVAPDGSTIAFIAGARQGEQRIWLRDLDTDQTRPLEGTEGAAYPFWSPDGRWIGFYGPGKLYKVGVVGGPPIPLCDAQDGRGGSWSQDGVILFQPRFSDPLYKVAAGGGTPEKVTSLEESRFDVAHRWPYFLPDGRRFLFYIVSTTNPGTSEHSGIYVGSLDGAPPRQLLRVDSRMETAQGFLLYKRSGTLMAHPFDADSAELAGDALPLAADLRGGAYSWGGAQFGVSRQGVLAFLAGAGEGETELAWFDRSGKRLEAVGDEQVYWDPRLSHDGTKLLMGIGKDAADLWLHDLSRDVRTRFTFDPADDSTPVWSPDDRKVAYRSSREEIGEIYVRDAAGTGEDTLLLKLPTQVITNDWSPDGRTIVFTSLDRETGFDLWTLSLDDGEARPWLKGPLDQFGARLSPDGRWMAYGSSESGRMEVYVQTFPDPAGGRWQVSKSGGSSPSWRRDGREMFFLSPDGGTMMAVDIQTGAGMEIGTPRTLFTLSIKSTAGQSYDPTPDGQRFLINAVSGDDPAGLSATLILNWPAALSR